MSTSPLSLSPEEARAFQLRATGLAEPHANVASAMKHHGFVQIDPINVSGRMHEHILRTRVRNYAEGDLHQHLHGLADGDPVESKTSAPSKRVAFEHFHPKRTVLAAFPLEAWPYLRTGMHGRAGTPGRWLGKLTAAETLLAKRILKEIESRGGLSSIQIDHDARSHNGWGTSREVKVVMDKLFGHGRLLITRRQSGRRVYDLPERVLPRKTLERPEVSRDELERFRTKLKLRQHRLVPLSRAELPHVEDLVQSLEVNGCALLYCLRSDLKILESDLSPPSEPRLIAPLDPLILDRKLLSQLWNFDYTWEVYTPLAKRKRGYYALPILAGDRLIGHVDAKVDSKARKLRVESRSCARGFRTKAAVAELARFLGVG